MGNIVFCRQNRAETAPLDVDWGVVKRGATLGNGMPQDEDWLEHGSVDGEVPDLQEEGDFDGEGGLVSSAERGLTANRVRESEQRLERGSLVLFPGENIELGSRDNHVELPSKAESVRAKTLRSPEDAEIGRGPEILQLESATGEGLQEVERGGNGVEKGALGRIESGEGYRPAHAEKGRGKGELIDEVSKRSERLRLEQEGGQKGGDGMRRGTEKVTEEGERIETEGREKEEVRKRGELEGRAEEKEPTTARGEEFDESDMEAEDEGGGPFMRGVAASESNPESGLLSTKEGENGETTGREGVQSRARLELTSRAAEEYR